MQQPSRRNAIANATPGRPARPRIDDRSAQKLLDLACSICEQKKAARRYVQNECGKRARKVPLKEYIEGRVGLEAIISPHKIIGAVRNCKHLIAEMTNAYASRDENDTRTSRNVAPETCCCAPSEKRTGNGNFNEDDGRPGRYRRNEWKNR